MAPDGHDSRQTDATAAPPPGTVDATGVVVIDIPCRECTYDLRGLRFEGQCPECGTPLCESIHPGLLRYAAPGYVRALADGVRLVLVGLALASGAVILLTGGGMMLGPMVGSPVVDALLRLAGGGLLILLPVCLLVVFAGAWQVTNPDPDRARTENVDSARDTVRAFVGLALIGVALLLMAILMLFNTAPIDSPAVGVCVLLLVYGLSFFGLVATSAYYIVLSDIAKRVPHKRATRDADILVFLHPIVLGATWLYGLASWGPPWSVAVAIGATVILLVTNIACVVRVIILHARLHKPLRAQIALAQSSVAARDAQCEPEASGSRDGANDAS